MSQNVALIQPPPEIIILTSTFIHAPGLSPDLEGVRFSLDGAVCRGVLEGQAWQGLGRSRGRGALAEGGGQGWVHRGVRVGAPVARDAVLRAALAVLPGQLLSGGGRDRYIQII